MTNSFHNLYCCSVNLCCIQSGAAVPYGVRRERKRERERERLMEGNVYYIKIPDSTEN